MAAPSSSSMFANSPNQIPIFYGELYEYWKVEMETIFISQALWDIVQESIEQLPQENDFISTEKGGIGKRWRSQNKQDEDEGT